MKKDVSIDIFSSTPSMLYKVLWPLSVPSTTNPVLVSACHKLRLQVLHLASTPVCLCLQHQPSNLSLFQLLSLAILINNSSSSSHNSRAEVTVLVDSLLQQLQQPHLRCLSNNPAQSWCRLQPLHSCLPTLKLQAPLMLLVQLDMLLPSMLVRCSKPYPF